MVTEVELYRQRKRAQRTQAPTSALQPAPEPALSDRDLYIVRKDEARKQHAAAAALRVENVGNPDENAAQDKIAEEYKTNINPDVTPPPSFVAQNKDRMERDLRRRRTTTALASSPMLTRWLDDTANARVAADDVTVLAGIEAALRHTKNALKRGVVDRGGQVSHQISADLFLYSSEQYGKSFADRYKQRRGDNYGYFFGAPDVSRITNPDGTVDITRLSELGSDPLASFLSAAAGTAVDVLNQFTGSTEASDLELAATHQKAAADFAKAAQETPVSPTAQRALSALVGGDAPLSVADAARITLDLAVNDPGALMAMVAEVGVESLGALIPATAATLATRNPAVGAGVLGGTSYVIERNLAPVEFFAKKGFDLTKPDDVKRALENPELMQEAADLGHVRGLIIGALDLVSGGVAGKVLAKNPIADAALQALVQGSLGGAGEGLAQGATEGEVNYGEVVVEALAEFSTAPVDVAAIGARKLGERKAEAKRATERAPLLQRLAELATSSKVRERAPDKFKNFVERTTKGGETENLYFPPDAFVSYFQSQDVALEDVAEILPGVDIDQIRRAQATGEDIVMPMATYMERVAGSEVDAFVVENAKFAPQEMTAAEAQEFASNEVVEQARVAAQQEVATATKAVEQDLAERIETEVAEQLVAAGRARIVAQKEAQLYPAFYSALATRSGKSIEDVVADYRVPKIRGAEVAPLERMTVDSVTRDMAALRARLERETAKGEFEPRNTSEAQYLDAVDDAVREAGLDPFTATDDEVRAAVTAKLTTFAQGKRGRISIPEGGVRGGDTIIDLFQSADLSTFLHESAHFFLTVLEDAAAREGAASELRAMLNKAEAWFRTNAKAVAKDGGVDLTEDDVVKYLDDGTTGDTAKDEAVARGTQEQWARAFETYLLEGTAPTPGLRGAFEQFRAWLMEVYKRVKGELNVAVSDDIRQVFDMLLATDEEIAAAREDNSSDMLAASAAELGVSQQEYEALATLHREAQDQTAAKTIAKAMEPIRRMRDAKYKERRAAIQAEVETEVNARPVYRAIEWMGNKRWLGAKTQPKIPSGMRLSKEQLIERYGPGVLRTLPRGAFRVYTPGGMDIDEAAGWFGFASGDEMVKAMESEPRRADVIAHETDRRAMEELADEDSVAQAAAQATKAYHEADKQGAYIAAELRNLHRSIGELRDSRVLTAKYARQIARRTIAGMKTRDAVAVNRYLAAERREANAAQQAFKAGDRKRAAGHKYRQLFNHMMVAEANAVVDEVAKVERLAKRLGRKNTRKNLAPEYLGAIDDVLEQYDFRKIGPGKENNRARMLAYVDMMKAAGRENEIAIPSHVLENAKAEPYLTLPVDRMRGLYATLKNIESTARRAKKVIDAKKAREMDQIVNDIGDAFANNVKPRPPSRVPTRGERLRRAGREFMDLVLNADTLLREIDGYENMGAAYRHLKQGLDEATARLQVRRRKAANKFEELYGVYTAKERNEMAVAMFVPELNASMAKWDLISIALNMGNADNRQRLTDRKVKGSFTERQLDAVLARLDKRDMDFVQSVWDYVDSFYEEIAQRERRVTGVSPQKVEAQELQTAHGVYRGGYYPLKYDSRLSDRVAEETADEVMANMRSGRFGKAQTQNGHTKERAQSSGRAVLLDIGVLHGHINTVLHDLELSEQVTNAWRILQEPRIKGMFLDNGRQVDHQALEMWVQDVASGQVPSAHVLARTARFLKSGFTVSKLAFNLSTVAVQVTGITQSMAVIGKRNFVKGAIDYLKHPVDTSADVLAKSDFMAERETTFNKDIYDIMGDIKVGPKAGLYKRAMQNYVGPAAFYLMQKTQFYAVDVPTWLGAYQRGLRESGNDETAAIQFADRMVARAQASGIFSDRSPVERGTLSPTVRQNDFVRLFTALGSYMFAKANVAYERTGRTDFRSPKEIFSYTIDMALLFTVEAVLYNAIKGTLPGMGDEDDESWAVFLGKETGLAVMGTMPFVRDLASPLQGYNTGGSYGAVLETLVEPFLQASQGEVDKAFVRSVVNSGGMLLHLPASQVNRFIDAGWRQAEGEDVSPVEYVMGKR